MKIGFFHVVVVEKRQRIVQKGVIHVQSYCFTFTSSMKHENWLFSRRSRRKTAKNCTKRCDTRAKLLFCFLSLLLLWLSPCRHRRLMLRCPLFLCGYGAIIHHTARKNKRIPSPFIWCILCKGRHRVSIVSYFRSCGQAKKDSNTLRVDAY